MASNEVVKVVLVERRRTAIPTINSPQQTGTKSHQGNVFELRPVDLSKDAVRAFTGPSEAFDFLEENQRYRLADRALINKWFESAAFRRTKERNTVSNVRRWLDKYSGLCVEEVIYYDAVTLQPIPSDQLKGPTVWLFSGSGFLCPCESLSAAFSEIDKACEVIRLRNEAKAAGKIATPVNPPRSSSIRRPK